MALSVDPASAADFVGAIARSATPAEWLWQLGAVAAALLVGRYVSHAVCRRIKASSRWKFGKGDFERVAFPLLALLFVAVAEAALQRFQSVALVNLVKSLLGALAVIRAAVYVLGHIIPEGALLRSAVRIIAWIAWIAVVLHVTGLLPDVVAALDEVGVSVGKSHQRVTLWLALQAFTALVLTLTIALWLARVTETRVLASETIALSTRIVIGKLVNAAALVLAVLIALPFLGIDITALSVFTGALGVGLGFGLQKIASNYVSGFIVLLDKSLRIGDLVTVDGHRGEVKAIESRYTVLKALDGTESIIPNELLISQTVIHHTYSDPRVLLGIPVSIAYDSDVERACALLLEVARRQPRIIADPPPAARVKALADSAVDMQLSVWIADPGAGDAELRSDVLKDILRTFRAHGIEIPYPRRDVHLIATAATVQTPHGSRT